MRFTTPALLCLGIVLSSTARAAEPNETFLAATLLPHSIRSVTDELTVEFIYPDTFLGIRSSLGEITQTNDDDSFYGDGFASGIRGVGVPDGNINFAVTGFGDVDFAGDHSETGGYETFVDVYDFGNELVASFSEVRTLAAGEVHEFSYSDPDWIGGKYDVNIDNINGPNDVDFFTFQGLTPGATFTARTEQIDASNLDTYLGWFSAAGQLLATDDDSGGGGLSLLEGIVPAGGKLTFAVSAFGDPQFEGSHNRSGGYDLVISQDVTTIPGDYNGNGVVDAADYAVWRDSLGRTGTGLAADGDPNGTIDGVDFDVWKAHFGAGSGGGGLAGSAQSVPEPATVALLGMCVIFWLRPRACRSFALRR